MHRGGKLLRPGMVKLDCIFKETSTLSESILVNETTWN